jgi:hypothetical protein
MRHRPGTARCAGICVLDDAVTVHADGPRPCGVSANPATLPRSKSVPKYRRLRTVGSWRGREVGGWAASIGLLASMSEATADWRPWREVGVAGS